MIRVYLILNLLLGAVAVAATGWMFLGRDAEPPAVEEPPAFEYSEDTLEITGEDDMGIAAGLTSAVGMADVEKMWQRVLFNPERRERVELEPEPPAETSPVEIELMAIGIVGSRAAAVIVVEEAARTRRSPGQRRGGTVRERTQNVYSLGDSLGGTGYTIEAINMEEVILIRGDEERILRLDPASESSQQRRETAARARRESREEDEVEPERRSRVPRPPPLPEDETEEEREDREERIRRAIERRRERIEELRSRQREQ